MYASIVCGIALTTIAVAALAGLIECDQIFTYPLDDTYIHLSVAKTIAFDGVWGISSQEFVSSSSSPLWSLLLASVFRIFGVQELAPLVINLGVAVAIVIVADKILVRYHVASNWRFFFLLLIALCTPLPAIVLGGMEHPLQCLVALLLMDRASYRLSRPQEGDKGMLWDFIALGAITPMVRYEGLFAIATICIAFGFQKRWKPLITLTIAAAAPVIAFGVYSMKNGGIFFPNSIFLKAIADDHGLFWRLGGGTLMKLGTEPLLIVLLISAYIVARSRSGRISAAEYWLILLGATALLHIQFSTVGWLYRYEAYLILLGIIAIAINLKLLVSRWRSFFIANDIRRSIQMTILAFFAIGVIWRALGGAIVPALAMRDRLYEHITSARFIGAYFNNATIASNDIGAIAFYTNAEVLDIFGLGSNEPIRFRKTIGRYTANEFELWAKEKDVSILLVKPSWEEMDALVPKSWIKVADWHLPRNVVFHDYVLSFFAPNRIQADEITMMMRNFSGHIPSAVKITYPHSSRDSR